MTQRRNRKRYFFLLFLGILSLINVIIFLARDRFIYHPYSSNTSLYTTCNDQCIKDWSQFVSDYPAGDLVEAKRIADSILQQGSQKTIDKILRLSGSLYEKFKSRMGKPSQSLNTAAPLDQYKMLCKNESAELWCGNLANMFAFFCWAEDIPCRIIEIMNPGDHHVINECYISDINKWVMVDITTNQLLTQTLNNQPLNVLDFKASLNDPSPLLALKATGDSVRTDTIFSKAAFLKTFYKKENPLYYYYRINNTEVYKPSLKLYRYLFPVSWYKIIAEKKQSNCPFYIKQFAIFLWALTGLLLIIAKLKGKLKGRQPAA